jgi:uncharacterized protein YdeI (YjbR/CyaY-like superfamily)
MPRDDDLPVLAFASPADFERWLETTDSPGVWLKIARAASGIPTVTYREAVDVALCFGWIDSHKAKFDESHFVQRFTPRRRTSRWSQVNCRRATELIRTGAMRPAGLAEVERARADGRWDAAYAPPSTAEVPPDLLAALAADPVAERFFATLNSRNRFAVLYRIGDAKRPETRAARIEKYVAMLHDQRTIYP